MLKNLEKLFGFEIEVSANPQFGDYSSSVALKKSKEFGKPPREVAEEIVEDLKKKKEFNDLIEKTEIAGPGFINFWLKNDVLVDNLIHISKQKEVYGKSNILENIRVLFEYAHPNTHKAFHIGHLRNIATGECLARIYETNSAQVKRANYQGDVGLHIAKALYGIGIVGFTDPGETSKRAEYLGKAYAEGATKFEESDEAKEEVAQINKKIYDGSDKDINELYKTTRQWSLDYFDSIYQRVYTKFDRLYFESEVFKTGKKLAEDALEKGVFKKSDGAVIFPGSEYGLHDRVFISGKGVPTYEAKDLGLAELQFKEFHPDKIIHTVGPEQTSYFQVVFKALELIQPETRGRELHIPYGWVRLKEGKMSSRTGKVVLGEDILNIAREKIIEDYKTDPEIAEMIAVGAVKYSFLKTGLAQEIAFDLKESISLEGNSGPYLQYTVARCNSVLLKANIKNGQVVVDDKNIAFDEAEERLARMLMHFSEIVQSAALNYAPNLICNYLYELAKEFNAFYAHNRIINTEKEETRLLITNGVLTVLKNGLNLLGIKAPEKM